MSEPAAGQHYSSTAKILHWAVAGLVVAQYALANLAELAAEAGAQVRQLALLANHKSVGVSILALALVRLAWRAAHRPPPLPAAMPRWQAAASKVSHGLLYVLLLATPLSGWLMSSASAYSVSWFNLLQLPDLVPPDAELKEVFAGIHGSLALLLAAVAGVHILAAFKHALIDRDGVLRRMTSTVGLGVFAAAVLFGILVLGAAGQGGPAAQEGVASPPAVGSDAAQEETAEEPGVGSAVAAGEAAAPSPPAADAALGRPAAESAAVADAPVVDAPLAMAGAEGVPPRWSIDYGASFISFAGDQAGAQFQGIWSSWEADIRFSGNNLAASSAVVTINTAAADTQDAERDATLVGPDWFDTGNFPQAQYLASSFSRGEDGAYVAQGELIVKGAATPAALNFSVQADGARRVLVGEAQLDRIALGLGVGEWLDTSWVGRDVQVHVRVEATVPLRTAQTPNSGP